MVVPYKVYPTLNRNALRADMIILFEIYHVYVRFGTDFDTVQAAKAQRETELHFAADSPIIDVRCSLEHTRRTNLGAEKTFEFFRIIILCPHGPRAVHFATLTQSLRIRRF